MSSIKKNFIGLTTFVVILSILTAGVTLLSLINIPRIIPYKKWKPLLGAASNEIGTQITGCLQLSLKLLHNYEWEFDMPDSLDTKSWYLGMSNHQSWADIFILLIAGYRKLPLLKFFMKKELQWIPIIYLVHKTVDMPFLNRHSFKQIQANPELKRIDYENAKTAAKRFSRNPSTAFSFVEGTRFTPEKHQEQDSPYPNLLKPKVGALVIALSGMPHVNFLVDFTVVYASTKRSTWSFLCGEMSQAKVVGRMHQIPSQLKNSNFEGDKLFRSRFQDFIEKIWNEKQEIITSLKF